MPREGRRPGAAEGSPRRGAPKGNLNALKTGARSKQLRAAIGAILSHDETRRVLLAILEQKRRERLRFQALVLASAKLIHNTELSARIRRKLEQYFESERPRPESEKNAIKQLNSIGQIRRSAAP
jgi:superfamily I DNA/RNA helicase